MFQNVTEQNDPKPCCFVLLVVFEQHLHSLTKCQTNQFLHQLKLVGLLLLLLSSISENVMRRSVVKQGRISFFDSRKECIQGVFGMSSVLSLKCNSREPL